MRYLNTVDSLLSPASSSLSDDFRRLQVDYVTGLQLRDGGFCGRQGASDIYYTDFALRVLALLAPECAAMQGAAGYVSDMAEQPRDVVECFCLLNCVRLLGECGISVPVEREPILGTIRKQVLPEGGFARPGGHILSAYHTFIACLCHELLGEAFLHPEAASAAIAALRGPSGGFKEQPGEGLEQTSATAAAVSFLQMTGGQTAQQAQAGARFLGHMQAPDGGLLAHEQAPYSDLLSSFTALLTLATLGALGEVDMAAVARFVKKVADPEGGFRACLGDTSPDIEHTYYGLGCLALLRVHLTQRRDAQVCD